jgi:hypothetical protein
MKTDDTALYCAQSFGGKVGMGLRLRIPHDRSARRRHYRLTRTLVIRLVAGFALPIIGKADNLLQLEK